MRVTKNKSKKTAKTAMKNWVIRPTLLQVRPSTVEVTLVAPIEQQPEHVPEQQQGGVSMATLRANATAEWEKLQTMRLASSRPEEEVKTPGRARNFAFPPDKATITTFKRDGFDEWLTRVKQLASVTATITQLAEFIAWWKHTRKEM
jgi:hypothetical protein